MTSLKNAFNYTLSLAILAVATSPASAQTLPEAVTLALQTNPGLESQRANLRALGQRRVQAVAQRRMQI
eukprot:gene17989-25183_t